MPCHQALQVCPQCVPQAEPQLRIRAHGALAS